MSGVAENLDAALTQRCTEAGYLHLAERADAPLSEAVRLLAREAFTGRDTPAAAQRVVDLGDRRSTLMCSRRSATLVEHSLTKQSLRRWRTTFFERSALR